MPIETWSEDTLVIHLSDDPQFSDDLELADSTAGADKNLVLDLSAVHFVNSSNIARLLRLRKRLAGTGKRLLLCSVSNQVWGVLQTTGLDKLFEIFDAVPIALAALQLETEG